MDRRVLERKIVDKCQDFGRVRAIIENNKEKKIIIFGAGTATEALLNGYLRDYEVTAIIDNNASMQGKVICGVKVIGPDELITLKNKNIMILIVNRHIKSISAQLDELGLVNEVDYYDVFTPLLPYFRMKKYESMIDGFLEFLDTIPQNMFKNIPISKKNKIGIVCICETSCNLTCYALAKALFLRYYGYKADIIIDSMKAFESLYYFDGIEEIARQYVDEVLDRIKEICPDIEIKDVTQEGEMELDSEDEKEIQKKVRYLLKWFDAMPDAQILNGLEDRQEISKRILRYTDRNIKKYMSKNKYDSLDLYTGIHRHRGMYVYTGHKLGMRVSTCDFFESRKMQYASDGVAGHSLDVSRVINNNYFSKEELKVIISKAKNNFRLRMESTIADKGYNYQPVLHNNNAKKYDIVIPLNIEWDAAALERDRIFDSTVDWLSQTLEYIMNNTKATVIIREHPAQTVYFEFEYKNIEKELPIIKQNPERIYFASSNEKINTYDYIKRCKIVLPYTSTLGLEAAMLEKKVILHTEVYYDKLDIAYSAKNKEDYFYAISKFLENNTLKTCNNVNNAYIAYYCQMNNVLEGIYCTDEKAWMKMKFEELVNTYQIKLVVDVVAEGVPILYNLIKETTTMDK